MNLRFIDWIWHVRGSLELAPGQSSQEALERLDPLFHETGTSHERADDTLTFRKKDQPAQDKMSVFDSGVLRIEKRAAGSVLRYHLVSRTLLSIARSSTRSESWKPWIACFAAQYADCSGIPR